MVAKHRSVASRFFRSRFLKARNPAPERRVAWCPRLQDASEIPVAGHEPERRHAADRRPRAGPDRCPGLRRRGPARAHRPPARCGDPLGLSTGSEGRPRAGAFRRPCRDRRRDQGPQPLHLHARQWSGREQGHRHHRGQELCRRLEAGRPDRRGAADLPQPVPAGKATFAFDYDAPSIRARTACSA
jgi:hypothetical protein